MKQVLDFLSRLAQNNNREWFNAHKDEYQEVKAKIEALTATLLTRLAAFEPGAARMSPSDCLYRIYRDTRFSPDKTPYKTHIGIYISPVGGKKSEYAGYYLHLEPGNCLIAGGSWCPPTPLLKQLRKEIYDNIEEYVEIIDNPEFKKTFPVMGENLLKTAPKGFPKDWEYIDLLRPRDFTALGPISDKDVCSSKLIDIVIAGFEQLKPLNDFFNFTFEDHPDLAHCRPTRNLK